MIQNFKSNELERNFEPIEWNQYENYEELHNHPNIPDHANPAACDTPNPPWWCDDAMSVPIDNYIIALTLIALIIAVIYLRRNKLKT